MALPWKLERVATARTALEAAGWDIWETGAIRMEDMVMAAIVEMDREMDVTLKWQVVGRKACLVLFSWHVRTNQIRAQNQSGPSIVRRHV